MTNRWRARSWALAWMVIAGAGLFWAATTPARELPLSSEPPSAEPAFGPVLERDELVRGVLANNPSLAAARSAWRAARERIPQATSLDDPMASLASAPLSLVDSDTRPGLQARASQRLPFPGTLGLRGDLAEWEASAAEHSIEEVRLDLAMLASLLFDQYYLVHRALEVTAEHRQLLDDFHRVAVSRYGTGLAPQQAPIQAEVEAAHVMHREVELRARSRSLVARINALLHRSPRAPLPPPPAVLEPPAPPPLPEDELFEIALDRRPEVARQRSRIEAHRTTVSLRELDGYPSFEVSTAYNSMWNMPEHRWMVGVGVSVPVWRERIRAGVAEAEARLDTEELELERLGDEVRETVEIARIQLEEARHVIHLYANRVLPAARDQVAAARAGFETGANSMLALIDAERTLRTAELEYHRAVADASTRAAELDRALGRRPFPAAGPAAAAEAAPREKEEK